MAHSGQGAKTPDQGGVGSSANAAARLPTGQAGRCFFLIALFLALLLPRIVYLYRVAPRVSEAPYADGRVYAGIALNALDGKGLARAGDGRSEMSRTPGYPLFVAFVRFFCPAKRWEYLYMAQAVLHSIADMLIFVMISSVFSPVAALIVVAWHATVGPLRIEMPHVMTENLYAPLLVFCCYAFWKTLRAPRWGRILWLGALLGYSVLVRPIAIAHVIGFAIGLLWCLKDTPLWPRMAKVGVVILIAVLVVVPWSIRNKIRCGTFQVTAQAGMLGKGLKAPASDTETNEASPGSGFSQKLGSVIGQPGAFARLVRGYFTRIWGFNNLWAGTLFGLAMLGTAAVLLWRRHPWGTYLLVVFGASLLMSFFWGIPRYSWPYAWIVVSAVVGALWVLVRKLIPALRRCDDAASQRLRFPCVPKWVWAVSCVVFLAMVIGFAGLLVARNYVIDSRPRLVAAAYSNDNARKILKTGDRKAVLTVRDALDREGKARAAAIGAPIIVTGEVRFLERWHRYYSPAEQIRRKKHTGSAPDHISTSGFGHVFEILSDSHLKSHSRGHGPVYCQWPTESLPDGIRDGAVVSVMGVVEPPGFWRNLRVRCAAARRLD